MKTNILLLSALATGLLLTTGLSSCKRGVENAPVLEPETTNSTIGGTIKLDEPVVLEFLVNPPHKMIKPTKGSASLRAVGDLSRTYTKTDKEKATVNTPRRERGEYNTGDEVYDDYMWRSYLYQTDWIRTLSIPELPDSEYKVEGVLGIDGKTIDNVGSHSELNPAYLPSKVTITLYSIPANHIMTFIANGKRYTDVSKGASNLKDLNLQNPYLLTSFNQFYLADWMKNPVDELTINAGSAVFSQDYLPMYARLYNVDRDDTDPTGRGIKGSETPSGTVSSIRTVYLERAVSLVTVSWDTPGSEFHNFVRNVEFGYFCNVTSVVPSNWEGVKQQIADYNFAFVPKDQELNKRIPSYWHFIHNRKFTWKELDSSINRECYGLFYVPENFPDQEIKQNSIVVIISEFKGNTITKTRYKYFDLPYGEMNTETGLMEIKRNTWYNLHIKLENTKEGVVPYIVDTWEDQPVDIPW